MNDILSYEADIWACADLLISSGIKQSKFPDYMMPFFALIMLEGRMRNEMRDIIEIEGIDHAENRPLRVLRDPAEPRTCRYLRRSRKN